jgi:hypothetical protein
MSDDKTREAALADALQLVLDDWANANMIGDDARADAEQALNMLDTNETPESPKGEEALVAGQATNGASGDNPGRCGSVRTLADSKGSTCRQTESAAPDESNRHCQYAQDVGMPEYRCAVECRYMQSSTAAIGHETDAELLAKHRIKPEWHRRGRSLAFRILDVDWQSQEDRRATLVAEVACEIRDAVEAALAESASGEGTLMLLQRARWALEGTDPDVTPLTSEEHARLVADLKAASS